jgi:hypothetical protein
VKDSVNLDVLLAFNSFATVLQVFKRFPLVKPLQYLFAPFGKVRLFAQMEKATRNSVLRRIGTSSAFRFEALSRTEPSLLEDCLSAIFILTGGK